MASDRIVKAAQAAGRRHAKEVLKLRADARRRRLAALAKHIGKLAAEPTSNLELADHVTKGVLIAEGDSWFDYPFNDILESLENDHLYDVTSVAHHGDPIEQMAYGPKQLADFTRAIEKLLDGHQPPKAVLLSGGGDDIAGDAFGMLINHKNSGLGIAGLNDEIVDGVINKRIYAAYVFIITAIDEVCLKKVGHRLPILVHGYDYAVPDGRGFLGGWGPLPGPWLDPGFREKGYGDKDMATKRALVKSLINTFNDMLDRLAAGPDFAHVHHVNLRGVLKNEPKVYKDWWDNELHPTRDGFDLVTKSFVKVLDGLK
jgi:hypothetical protein